MNIDIVIKNYNTIEGEKYETVIFLKNAISKK
jgi:hypothetical protein